MVTPLDIIAKGAELNPQITKIVIAIPVLLAAVALGLGLFDDWQTALIGGLIAIVTAVVLLIVAQLAANSTALGAIGVYLARFCGLFFALSLIAMFTCFFFDWPKPLICLVRPLDPCRTALADFAARQAPSLPTVNKGQYTVYTQFAGYSRDTVQTLRAQLTQTGWRVPGEERTGTAAGLNEIRYRAPEDKPAADLLANEIQATGVVGSRIQSRQVGIIANKVLELWISR